MWVWEKRESLFLERGRILRRAYLNYVSPRAWSRELPHVLGGICFGPRGREDWLVQSFFRPISPFLLSFLDQSLHFYWVAAHNNLDIAHLGAFCFKEPPRQVLQHVPCLYGRLEFEGFAQCYMAACSLRVWLSL